MAEVFNRRDLYNRLEGDEELLGELLALFLEQVHGHLEALDSALQGGDALRLEREAHALKGAAAAISAEAVQRAAADLEMAGKHRALAEAPPLLAALKQEISRFREVLRN
jgi:two-component system sensor histidine kinase/response regulator